MERADEHYPATLAVLPTDVCSIDFAHTLRATIEPLNVVGCRLPSPARRNTRSMIPESGVVDDPGEDQRARSDHAEGERRQSLQVRRRCLEELALVGRRMLIAGRLRCSSIVAHGRFRGTIMFLLTAAEERRKGPGTRLKARQLRASARGGLLTDGARVGVTSRIVPPSEARRRFPEVPTSQPREYNCSS